MSWKNPDANDAATVIASTRSQLLICSPFISGYGLALVSRSLPQSAELVEVWTRIQLRDWVTGASEPDALLDFLDALPTRVHSQLYTSPHLHAKFLLADQDLAWAGSSNLTAGGFANNIEIGKVVQPPEITEILRYANDTRGLLSPTSRGDLRSFVTECQRRTEDREALLELVQDVAPAVPGKQPLVPLRRFIDFCKRFSGEAADDIRVIYYNTDGNNRTGHLKQGYYAVQRFLQEYPQHLGYVSGLPEERFDLRGSRVETDWHAFVARFPEDGNDDLGYDLRILIDTYLTPAFGGRRLGGGGGDPPFKLVWPFVGRLMASR